MSTSTFKLDRSTKRVLGLMKDKNKKSVYKKAMIEAQLSAEANAKRAASSSKNAAKQEKE